MPTRIPETLAVLALVVALVTGGLPAQLPTTWTPDAARALLAHRELARDDDGALRWQPFEADPCERCDGEKTVACQACRDGEHGAADNCAECRGRQRAPCGRCAGSGETLDPLREIPCPSCDARVRIPCRICDGVGRWHVLGGGNPSCAPCGARGGHACSTCRGRRKVPVLEVDGDPIEEADAEQLAELDAQLATLREDVDAFLELVKRTRPKPPAPEELLEPFGEMMAAATKIDPVWKKEPLTLAGIEKSLRKYRAGGTFTTRNLNHPTTIRLEYRRSATALGAWVGYHRQVIEGCQKRHADR